MGRLGGSDSDRRLGWSRNAATQSHAMAFNEFPVTRMAWPGQFRLIQENTGALTQCCFTAVIVGVTEVALETARQQVASRRNDLRAYERVEWSKAELEGWLIQQAYEGMLRAVEEDRDRRFHAVKRKLRSRNWGSRSFAGSARSSAAARSLGPRPSDIGTKTCARSAFCARLGGWPMINCLPLKTHSASAAARRNPESISSRWSALRI